MISSYIKILKEESLAYLLIITQYLEAQKKCIWCKYHNNVRMLSTIIAAPSLSIVVVVVNYITMQTAALVQNSPDTLICC